MWPFSFLPQHTSHLPPVLATPALTAQAASISSQRQSNCHNLSFLLPALPELFHGSAHFFLFNNPIEAINTNSFNLTGLL